MDIEYIESLNGDEIDIEADISKTSRLLRRPTNERKICAKDERNASIKKVSQILLKGESERTVDELLMLRQCSDAVEEVQSRWRKRDEAKRRVEEIEEPMEQLKAKCHMLAQAIAGTDHLVVYTGAGISTAAQIPDYRGTNGIWTRLQQGKDIGNHDLSQAEPTYTHMALSELYRQKTLKYVVSQNCDGLHLRSGLPRTALSELHGNMYIEVCKNCKPTKEYWRTFDVTENTARFSHKTMRKCYQCNGPLVDTIVHFGERGTLQWPLNWSGACVNSKKATTIICLGSSLKVLKKYPWLWQMDKPVKKRPNLYIVNLQWTPKDDCANIKIHGKCDEVMKMVMNFLGITVPPYSRENDPIFTHGTNLCDEEMHTTTQPILKFISSNYLKCEIKDESLEEVKQSKTHDSCNIQTINNTIDLSNMCSNLYKIEKSDIACDNSSNTNMASNLTSNHCSLPTLNKMNNTLPPKTNSVCTAFSIDNILYAEKKTSTNSNHILPHRQLICRDVNNPYNTQNLINNNIIINHDFAVLRYYQISNILLQNQMLSYHDLIHYPFQTSLLYSGLHNIIRPGPYYNENCFTNNVVEQNYVPRNNLPMTPACKFCSDHHKSICCLFYSKFDPNFVNPKIHITKLDIKKSIICVCCDNSSDDEFYDRENKIDDYDLPGKIKKVDDTFDVQNNYKPVCEKEQLKKIQAGWFGKGYKKHKRPKKR